jgi:hypothetical protein
MDSLRDKAVVLPARLRVIGRPARLRAWAVHRDGWAQAGDLRQVVVAFVAPVRRRLLRMPGR